MGRIIASVRIDNAIALENGMRCDALVDTGASLMVSEHIRGHEKGEAQLFLDRLFQAFGQKGILEVGGQPEFRIRKA